jgi:hypothetical protein
MIIEDQRAELDALAGQDDPVTGARRALIQAQYHLDMAMAGIEDFRVNADALMGGAPHSSAHHVDKPYD